LRSRVSTLPFRPRIRRSGRAASSCARRRDHPVLRQPEADLALPAQPPQPRRGEDDRVVLALGELAQPRVDVAVQVEHLEVGPRRQELGAPAEADRPYPRALGHVLQRGSRADPGVGRILARRHRGDLQPLDLLAGQILGRVDADLGAPVEHRPLDRPHEARLVARLAVRGDLDQLGPADQLGDHPGLRERQRAGAGSYAERHAAPIRRRDAAR
jgi:hypothetical protein